jgi:ubiquinone/menaquinone biosynthesis C-methylase UbiE
MDTFIKKTTSAKNSHVCPWWLAYTFDNPLRRLLDPSAKALAGIVFKGMTVIDVGCGFGHFSIGAARLVGPTGRVIAADLQEKMLEKTMARARRCGLAHRITPWQCQSDRIGYTEKVDAAIAANVVHETPDPEAFLREIHALLKPGGNLLVTEPAMHVDTRRFDDEKQLAATIGFSIIELPRNMFARRAVFERCSEDETR